MTVSIMPLPKQMWIDSNGKPLSGAQIFTYQPGTVRSNATLVTTYTDSTGLVPNSNPVIADSAGRTSIWLSSYVKVDVLDANSVPVYTGIDNLSSMPNTALSSSEWVLQSAVLTYIGATQFSVPSDLTATFQVNRRIKAVVSAGTIYGTITVSSAGGSPVITTVTVVWDSGALDAGLSAVSVGIISPSNSSLAYSKANGIAMLDANSHVVQIPANATFTPAANTVAMWNANKDLLDRNSNPLFAPGVPNSNANSSNKTLTVSNIAVTNGDILVSQTQVSYTAGASQKDQILLQSAGVTCTWLQGISGNIEQDLNVTANTQYSIPLTGFLYIGQTGNLSLTSAITTHANSNGVTNNIGYAFWKKQ